ncbi:MAG: adenylate/guanylate cyclase domain-containing protein [Stappia sp.]|uniref:adenylate/guanylate cyclase domain-containing protein n=1 Tax=Stappia sp. TaxID=1870903 RepID=UPI000C5E5132|nr:adenylate/guanylate cyclase domain-containing protein [Stappia sp.]MBM20517.1 adenylate/guanylate cyclase domain-containing protein [Stappia sp.]
MLKAIRRYGRGRLRGVSLTVLVGASFGLLLFVSMSLVLALAVFANAQNTFSLLNDKAVLITDSLERQVRNHLDLASSAVVHLKTMLDDGPVGIGASETLRPILLAAMNANPAIDVLVVTDLQKEEYGVYRAASGKLWPYQRNRVPKVAERYVLPELSANSPATWGPLLDSDGVSYANVTVPIVREGQLSGYLTAAVSLEELGRTAAALDDGADTTVFIIADGDEIIAHSDLDALPRRDNSMPRLPQKLTELGDPVLARFDSSRRIDNFKRAEKAGVQVSDVELEDWDAPDYVAITKVIAGYGPGVWTVGQYSVASSLSREIERLFGSAMVGFASILVTLVLAVLLARRTSRPLAEIARRARHIGALDFDSVDPLPHSRILELDRVYSAFNAMVVGLKAMNSYVPRSLFNKLMRLGVDQASASERDLTLVFTDIVGFTTLSESLSAAETAELLNGHFSLLVAAVEAEGGTVDKFIGDGMLAFWGAPDERPDHAPAALRACLRMAEAVHEANREAEESGRPVLRMRFGIHTGRVVVGNVGALDRWNYTVVGDPVNLCERLQSLGREVAPQDEAVILASEDALARISLDGIEAVSAPLTMVQRLGEHVLRGRSVQVTVWRVSAGVDPLWVGMPRASVEKAG